MDEFLGEFNRGVIKVAAYTYNVVLITGMFLSLSAGLEGNDRKNDPAIYAIRTWYPIKILSDDI